MRGKEDRSHRPNSRKALDRGDRARNFDTLMLASSGLLVLWTWIAERKVWERLADVRVPNGSLLLVLVAARIRQRANEGPLERLRESMSELGSVLGARMHETDERSKQLLNLQASIEYLAREAAKGDASIQRLTRWLVRLTVVLAVIGTGGIAATIWVAVH